MRQWRWLHIAARSRVILAFLYSNHPYQICDYLCIWHHFTLACNQNRGHKSLCRRDIPFCSCEMKRFERMSRPVACASMWDVQGQLCSPHTQIWLKKKKNRNLYDERSMVCSTNPNLSSPHSLHIDLAEKKKNMRLCHCCWKCKQHVWWPNNPLQVAYGLLGLFAAKQTKKFLSLLNSLSFSKSQ